MNTGDIKIDLFKKLDTLNGKRVKEVYGLITNFINSKDNSDEWGRLSSEQKAAIQHGIDQLERGEGKAHHAFMAELRNDYLNE